MGDRIPKCEDIQGLGRVHGVSGVAQIADIRVEKLTSSDGAQPCTTKLEEWQVIDLISGIQKLLIPLCHPLRGLNNLIQAHSLCRMQCRNLKTASKERAFSETAPGARPNNLEARH